MTSLHYKYLAKENVGSTVNIKSRAVSNPKELQENLVTPRRALGEVNKNVLTSQTPLAKSFGLSDRDSCKKPNKKNPPAPRRALSSISENKPKPELKPKKTFDKPLKTFLSSNASTTTTTTTTAAAVTTTKSLPTHDDIENVHKPPQKPDDYEDIWPKKERFSSYLDNLLSWRPSCFQIWQDEDSDCELRITDNEVVPERPETAGVFEETLYAFTDVAEADQCLSSDVNITLPDIDELLLLSDDEEES
ncbi:hypothetical protein Ahia01_000867900 [Argonauta hians]